MYVRVYAPNGEPFDVTRERADRLILQDGWTQTKPVAEKRSEPAPAPVEFALEEPAPEEEIKETRPARGRKYSRRLVDE